MQLAKRVAQLKPSPTVQLNARSKELQANGVEVLNFGVGEPDFTTPQAIVDVAKESLDKGRTKYGAAGGGPAIRRAIANKLKRDNQLDFDSQQIVVGMGAKEILFHIFLSVLNEGDEVLVPSPYWVSYAEQIKTFGGQAVQIPMSGPDSRLDVKNIEAMASERTRCFVLTSPNNPAGYALDQDQLKELGALLRQKNWWIISDEIYEYLSFDHPHRSLLELYPELKDRFILVNGLSKGFAMTGWRVGYMAGPEPVAKVVRSLQSHSSTCLPGFIEDAACFALEQGKDLVKDELEELKDRRDFAVEQVKKLPHIDYIEPQGAFYLFIDLRPALEGHPKFGPNQTLAFCDWLLSEKHMTLVPGEAFGTPGFARMSYATDKNTLERGFARLGEAIEATISERV